MKTYDVNQVKIEGHSFVRDMSNKALLNTDLAALQAYKDRKAAMENITATKDELNVVKDEINTLKKDVANIVGLLETLIKKVS